MKIIFLILNSKYKDTITNFIHSYILITKKHGNVKENVSFASSLIHLL